MRRLCCQVYNADRYVDVHPALNQGCSCGVSSASSQLLPCQACTSTSRAAKEWTCPYEKRCSAAIRRSSLFGCFSANSGEGGFCFYSNSQELSQALLYPLPIGDPNAYSRGSSAVVSSVNFNNLSKKHSSLFQGASGPNCSGIQACKSSHTLA